MPERWDRDRFLYERSRDEQSRRGDDDDDQYTMRGGLGGRGRDLSEDGRRDRRFNRSFDDDDMVRDRRYYDDEPRFMPRREREQPPPEATRRVVLEKERERDYFPRRASPPRRPGFLRRQSSLDTFDRPGPIFQRREEYPPPARREDIRRDDFRAPPYTPIPLPKARGLPPPRRYPDQGFYDDIKVAEPELYGDEDYRAYPDRVREREVIKTSRRRRDRSRDSLSTRTRSHRSSSVTSSSSSHSSSSSGGTTVRSEYPKKGKTRIPAKLVSKRALVDLEYPFVQEGNTVIVQKALGQDNIDELLKVSEEYKKVEQEMQKPPAALMPPPEMKAPPPSKTPPAPPAPPAPEIVAPPAQAPPQVFRAPEPMLPPQPPPPQLPRTAGPAPVVVNAHPPFVAEPPAEYWEEITTRDTSPSRSSTTTSTSWDSHHHHHHGHRREKSAPIAVGPLALVERSRSRSRRRSKSRSGRELRAEIRALERELVHRPRGGSERELVRAERMPNGELVVYEEEVEKVVEHHKPGRIEKDKKGPPPKLMRAMLATLT